MSETIAHQPQTEPAGLKLENTIFWRIKLRLQFTGWLQYVMGAMPGLVLLLLAVIGRLIGVWQVALFWTPFVLGLLFLANSTFEIVALKFGVRPPEALPKPLDGMDSFEVMRARRSCRSFQKRNLTGEQKAALLESAARNSRPEAQLGAAPIRLEYIAVPLTVWPVVNCHEFLVAIAPKQYDRTAIIDIGRSLQKIVIEMTRLGLGTCWIGPGADQKSAEKALGDRFDADKDHVICVCAFGYKSMFWPLGVRMLTRSMGWRYPLDQLFFADPMLTEPVDTSKPPFSEFGRCYEVCQWSPSSYDGQTTRARAVAEGDAFKRLDFYAATASRYYAAVALGIWCANWELGCEALGIPGHFKMLTAADRGAENAAKLPHYDISWIAAQGQRPQ